MKTVVRLSRANEFNGYWIFIFAALMAMLVVSVLNDGLADPIMFYLFFSFLLFIMITYQGLEIIQGK